MILQTYSTTLTPEGISHVVKQVESDLQRRKHKASDIMSACVTLEDLLVILCQSAAEGEEAKVMIEKGIHRTLIRLSCKGERLLPEKMMQSPQLDVIGQEYSAEAENIIRQLVLGAYADRIKFRHSKGVNTFKVVVSKNQNAMLYETLIAIVSAVILGGLMRLTLPTGVCQAISNNLLEPLYILFLNAIKMIMAPLVFFSLASCVSGFSDLKTLGRTGSKVMGGYLFTTCLAIAFSYFVMTWFSFSPIDLSQFDLKPVEAASMGTVTLKDTLMDIIPSNFVEAFVKSNMMQIIFLSIMVGAAAASLDKRSEQITELISTMSALCTTITGYITRCMPLAVFGSFGSMVINISGETFQTVAVWVVTVFISLLFLLLLYILLLAVVGRLNPFVFMRKYAGVMLAALSTSSSNATIPSALEACGKRLGISPQVYSFSIPLGATVNMNGTSVLYITLTFFLAAITGTAIDPGIMFSLITTIILVAMAAPGVPGGAIACEIMLLALVGAPVESIALVLGIMPLVEPFLTLVNVLSDGIVTAIVARREGKVDMEMYNS